MDWLKDGLVPIAQTGIWATILYLLGGKALARFETTIARTLDRLKRAGPAEFEPIPATNQIEAKVETTPASVPLGPFPPDSVPAYFEKRIQETLHAVPKETREAYLTRLAAVAHAGFIFEGLNFLILGSQLALVQAASGAPVSIDQARGFYDHAETMYPDFYKSYPFESWLHWLGATAKFVESDAVEVRITSEGREFLQFLAARNYSLLRSG